MPNPENLRPAPPWSKGQSGNPNGYSRKRRIRHALIKVLDEQGLDGPFIRVGLRAALRGDFQFWSYIFDRVEGKAPVVLQGPDIDLDAIRDALKRQRDERRRAEEDEHEHP
jgi:hypothetical protein